MKNVALEGAASAEAGISRRAFIASGALVAGAAGSLLLASRPRIAVEPIGLDGMIPRAFGGWRNTGNVVPILPDEAETMAVDRVYEESLTRIYERDDGAIMMLVVAHGRPDSGMLAIHRPATCYTSQGFTVSNATSIALPAPFTHVYADKLFAERESRQEPILSWITVSGEQTGFGVTQKLRQLKAAWEGKPADAFLVRASTLAGDVPSSYTLIADFMVQFLRQLSPLERHLIAGSAAA